jgi:hypothetical protein
MVRKCLRIGRGKGYSWDSKGQEREMVFGLIQSCWVVCLLVYVWSQMEHNTELKKFTLQMAWK